MSTRNIWCSLVENLFSILNNKEFQKKMAYAMRRRTAPSRKRVAPKRRRAVPASRPMRNPAVARARMITGISLAAPSSSSYRSDTSMCKMRYCEDVVIPGSSAGVSASAIYKADGLWDPRVAIGGHQPIGFDQYMLFYDHFRVISSKITVSFVSPSTYAVIAMIQLRDDDTPINVTARNREVGNLVYRTLYGVDSTNKANTLTYKFDARKFYGPTYLDATHKGTSSADPTELAYFHVVNGAPDYATSADLSVNITIDYLVQFSERKPLTQS